jgi:hypothetical protein
MNQPWPEKIDEQPPESAETLSDTEEFRILEQACTNIRQHVPSAVPPLPMNANFHSLTNNNYLLLSLANSNQQASSLMPQQHLYTNLLRGALSHQDILLQPYTSLAQRYLPDPLAALPLYPQPSHLLLDPSLALYLDAHAHLFGLSNRLQAPLPHITSLLPGLSSTLQNTAKIARASSALAPPNVEEAAPKSTAAKISDRDGSSTSVKSEPIPKPKRPLSAYNFFFQAERHQIVQGSAEGDYDHRKRKRTGVSFEDLAKEISERWRNVEPDTLQYYENLARADKERYVRESELYKEQQDTEMTQRRRELESTVPEETLERYMKSQGKRPPKKKKAKN